MKKNKGFTLIELLAVIVILAIIALIATPIILNVIEESRENANKDSVYGIVDAAKLYYAQSILDGSIVFDENGIADIKDDIKISGGIPDGLDVKINDKGEVFVEALFDNMCFTKDYTSPVVIRGEDGTCSSISDNEGALVETEPNVPTLTDGLVAVEISENGTVTVVDTSNTNWYNYDESKWANAVILNDGVTAPSVGNTIDMSNINQMYVWIPRYKYSDITTADKPITIEFVDKTVTEGVHTAFSLEGTGEIDGIWVGKFEMAEDYKIIPNVNSLHNASVSTMYNEIMALNTGGSDNIHMLKNTEWGAVVYLSQSKYGICSDTNCTSKVKNNNHYDSSSYDITTGCGGDDTMQKVTGGICPNSNKWNTNNGMGASTTHNVTGVYDMAGGRYEYVMGVQYDSLTKENLSVSISGFNQDLLNSISSKFLDKYDYGTDINDVSRYILGDATVETFDWDENSSDFTVSSSPWFFRGGAASSGSYAGITYYSSILGFPYNIASTRAAIFGQ